MRRVTTFVLATLVGLGVTGLSEQKAHAQEIVLTGPLKGAPPVKKLRMYREGRFEIAPAVAFTLLDEYQHSYFFGGRISYFFTDWLGIGIWGAGAVNANTDLTSQIDLKAPRDQLTATNVAPNKPGAGSPTFADQTAKMVGAVFPQITAVPFRGKLALFQALFVDTEAYLFLGAGAVFVSQRAPCGDTSATPAQKPCSDPSTFTLATGANFAPTFGIGLTFFLNDIVNIGVEYRAFPFSWNRGGFDSRGLGPNGNFPDGKIDGNDSTFQFNQVINLSVGIMLGKRKTND